MNSDEVKVIKVSQSVYLCVCPVESDAFSDGQTQRGMDRYLDSLFDPVLSDSSIVSTETDLRTATNPNQVQDTDSSAALK